MTLGEWFALGGFALTLASAIVGLTRWLIIREIIAKIAEEREAGAASLLNAVQARTSEMEKLRKDWTESQSAQDRNFGEVGLSLRRFIETVEKDMHEAELWGRDHYVQKADFEKAIDKLSAEIKAGNAELKADLKDDLNELKAQIAAGRN